MSSTGANNKRIAQNTLLLYIRMFLVMGVSLYSSRLILQGLGQTDYGIYNIVAGVVTMLGFLTSSLAAASSRFITYSLGSVSEHGHKPPIVFSTIRVLHISLAIIILFLGETIGLYFINTKLVIPEGRELATFWVYQLSLITTIVSVLNIPHYALIIAQEHMKAFAYISILESFGKLLTAYLVLINTSVDNLILYAILYLAQQILVSGAYYGYTKKKFRDIVTTPVKLNRSLAKEMGIYASWVVSGNIAVIGYTQGINVLLNVFFGPIANAARGIAIQVQAAIESFINGFQTAIRPQIIKAHAVGDTNYVQDLLVRSSKYGFYLTLVLIAPIFFYIAPLLNVWLVEIPQYTIDILEVLLIIQILSPFRIPLLSVIHATGQIKKFQICESIILLSIIPLACITLKYMRMSPADVMKIYLFVEIIAQLARIVIVLPQIGLRYKTYCSAVLLPTTIVGLIALLLVLLTKTYVYSNEDETLASIIIGSIFLDAVLMLIIAFIGLNAQERRLIMRFLKNKVLKQK